jgi:hypothetical protein
MQRIPRPCTAAVVAAISFAANGPASADQWEAARTTEYQSQDGSCIFRVEPSPLWFSAGHCKGELFKIRDGKRVRAWSRDLINNKAPVRAYVADSGRYVITMDEWGQVGTFPVVVYGLRGELVAVHSTKSLGLAGEDILHIKVSVSSYWWNENALVFFDPREEVLCIRLHWGKLLLINLYDGELMSQEWYEGRRGWDRDARKWPALREYAEKHSGALAMKMLVSKEPKERETAALVAGQLQLREAIPALRALLADEAFYWSSTSPLFFVGMGKCYYVRDAARKALDQIGAQVPSSKPATEPSM